MMNQPNDPIVQQSFTRGELLLVVDHDPEMDRAGIVSALSDVLQEAIEALREGNSWLIPALEPQARKSKYDGLPEEFTNLSERAKTHLQKQNWGDLLENLAGLAEGESDRIVIIPNASQNLSRTFIRVKTNLDKPVEENTNEEKQANDLATAYLAAELNAFASPGREQGGKFRLIGVSPSWLFGAQMGGLTTGGPGSLPVLPDNVLAITGDELTVQLLPGETTNDMVANHPGLAGKAVKPNEKRDLNQKYAHARFAEQTKPPGTYPVHVYVLDTLPPRAVLKWAKVEYSRNAVIQNLLAGFSFNEPGSCEADNQSIGGLVEICYYERDDTLFQTNPHDLRGVIFNRIMVVLQDHGPFIVSLIYGAAPSAQQHLFQVLNDYGIGTMASLIWGIEKVLDKLWQHANEDPKPRVLVNCSLTINYRPPEDGDPRTRDPHERLLDFLVDFLGYTWLFLTIQVLYTLLPDEIVFAAAGNDSLPGRPRRPTGFPAAFDSVVGVGALKRDFFLADYSNIADKPKNKGFVAVGGDVANNVELADSEKGLLGIYISQRFPRSYIDDPAKGPLNVYGWARWAGTSFATAVATGVMARLCTLETSDVALKRLRDVIDEGPTDYNVLLVDQGN